ncbi:MAG: hypothetical protein QXY90_05215 [Candidatus Anstonellales archaeon]
MNIWLIQIGEILPLEEKARKMRTALLADKLVERGHKVFSKDNKNLMNTRQWTCVNFVRL